MNSKTATLKSLQHVNDGKLNTIPFEATDNNAIVKTIADET